MLLLCFFPPVPEKEILDFIAHGSIIQVFTVVKYNFSRQMVTLSVVQSHPAIRNAKSSGFFVHYGEVLEEIPYSEDNFYESRGTNSQWTRS